MRRNPGILAGILPALQIVLPEDRTIIVIEKETFTKSKVRRPFCYLVCARVQEKLSDRGIF
ncbi:hypothetical protein GCM10007094_43900 [Pseudovibrio japonicus]|uniref:Uncharacterized protein n=1 Tax=Pseudovibrio japonicus TaxID=366534 RepID=A0ABQ3ETX0_9HYPH|nr:hypothetical protein GCM10007094_43900 [Pseudovibrio japonicus]